QPFLQRFCTVLDRVILLAASSDVVLPNVVPFICPIHAHPRYDLCLLLHIFDLLSPTYRKTCIPYSRVLEGQHLSVHLFSGLGSGSTVYGSPSCGPSAGSYPEPVGLWIFHISTALFKERKRSKKKETAATVLLLAYLSLLSIPTRSASPRRNDCWTEQVLENTA